MWWRRSNPSEVIGLIAGQGEFPLLFAQAALSLKRDVIAFGVEGLTDRRLDRFVREAHYVELGSLGRLVELLQASRVREVVFAGGIPKKEIYNPGTRMDEAARGLIGGAANKGDDHLLRAFQIFLKAKCGVSVVDSRFFLKETLAPKGVLTRRAPSEGEWRDLRFGWKVAKGIGKMDIGQTVAVKHGVALAVEGLEGTNETIRRGGELGQGGVVVVKVSKPNQDLRFDLPCVGEATLDALKGVSSRVLGVEAGKTIMLFKERLIEKADRENMTIVGL
ncbi:MAG: UDP-2,3-diacylglucosamine diphosphatase LpxI [Candidatus Omnitrophica bacterium]|nr:UDP-2,3-diacylglucosamine diphosphatase LpxI [Candidatus Omnitrophota bacterium]